MARAIDADRLKQAIDHDYYEHYTKYHDSDQTALIDMVMDDIDEMPTLTPPNEALTLEQLREMNGEPAWWDDGEGSCWGIISVATNGRWAGIPFFRGRWKQAHFEYDIKSRGMTLYRRPPEGEEEQNV